MIPLLRSVDAIDDHMIGRSNGCVRRRRNLSQLLSKRLGGFV
jgi:hypothetical protein